MDKTTWDNVGKHYTSDGVLITEGMAVINYNFDADIVLKPVPYGNPAEPQWFYTQKGMFDGSRLRSA